MVEFANLNVQLIGYTKFEEPMLPGGLFTTNADGAEALIEFAGRACYQSWDKPNPRTATNQGYINHIIDVKHFSVLEHSQATFYITGVSRSSTHELVRHRHLSFSQLSQRYVPDGASEVVVPPDIADDDELVNEFRDAVEDAQVAYLRHLETLESKYAHINNRTERRKKARQAARAVLPNATETKIVVTGNFRAWRHFINLRATSHADVEIRALAVEILRQLQTSYTAGAGNVFADYDIRKMSDGTKIAVNGRSEES